MVEQTDKKVEAVSLKDFDELVKRVDGFLDRINTAVKSSDVAKNLCKDMNSRVVEIEQFRNHAAVEGKMRELFSQLENLTTSIGQFKAAYKKEIERLDKAIEALKVPVSADKS